MIRLIQVLGPIKNNGRCRVISGRKGSDRDGIGYKYKLGVGSISGIPDGCVCTPNTYHNQLICPVRTVGKESD